MQVLPVSAIIPTYNRAARVEKAVDSVLAQDYPAEAVEVLVIDDGSTDGTGERLRQRYGSRIRYHAQPNRGVSAARNAGLDLARHELVAFLDSDDAWEPGKLAEQTALMRSPDVVLSYTNWRYRGESADGFARARLDLDGPSAVLEQPLRMMVRNPGSGIWTSTCMCRKAAVARCGKFDERMRIFEDVRLWYRLAFEGRFAVCRNVLSVRGEEGEDNLTRSRDPAYWREWARLHIEICQETYARAVNAPLDVQDRLRYLAAGSLWRQAKQLAADGQPGLGRRKALEAFGLDPTPRSALRLALIAAPLLRKLALKAE